MVVRSGANGHCRVLAVDVGKAAVRFLHQMPFLQLTRHAFSVHAGHHRVVHESERQGNLLRVSARATSRKRPQAHNTDQILDVHLHEVVVSAPRARLWGMTHTLVVRLRVPKDVELLL